MSSDELDDWMEDVAQDRSKARFWHRDDPAVLELVSRVVEYNRTNTKKVSTKSVIDRLKSEFGITVGSSTLKHWVASTLGRTWNGNDRT